MNKKIFFTTGLLLGLMFYACKVTDDEIKITQPLVVFDVNKDTIQVGNTSIITGPLKDFEQGSDVVYRFTVTTEKPLTKFFVASTADAISGLSKVVRTEPENVIDSLGNFTPNVKNVIVYYAYRIDPLVPPGANLTLTFNFKNEGNYVGSTSDNFTVIKAGSTNGKLLDIIDFPFFRRDICGIGTQDNFNIVSGIRGENNVRLQFRRAPFYSIDLRTDLGWIPADVIQNADKFDFVGYRPRYEGTNPVLNVVQFYLVSPSNTNVLTTSYPGSATMTLALAGTSGTANVTAAGITKLVTYTSNINTTATNYYNASKTEFLAKGLTLTVSSNKLTWTTLTPGVQYDSPKVDNLTGSLVGTPFSLAGNTPLSDLKIMQLRDCVNKMQAKVLADGKSLRTVYFKRLDNITGPNAVSVDYFNSLTHDNEFDVLCAGIENEGKTITGALGFDQVYGFVMSDGRKGLFKTTSNSYITTVATFNSGVGLTKTIFAPNDTAGDFVLFCTIKVQKK